MNPHHRQFSFVRIPTWLGGLVLAVAAMTSWSVVHAQQSAPQITSVNLTSVSATSATIDFTTDDPAGGRIAYDTVAHAQANQYGKFQPTGGAYTADATSQSIPIGVPPNTLAPSTTYHYRIEVKNANGTTASADRTFTTKANNGTGLPLTVTNIVADCLDTRCRLQFTTSRSAKVEIRWDGAQRADFDSYVNTVKEANFTTGTRFLDLTNLAANKRYYYRVRATGETSGEFTTNELYFETSANGFDHVFTTGACPDGTAIGSCSPSGAICAPGGTLVNDCSSICGYVCPTNPPDGPSTCSVGGQCVKDLALNGSPYQCNNADCYESNGAFKALAPPGCYASWPECNANTILKVKKDRGCNLWLTCSTSLQTTPSVNAPAENLCLSLAACNSLNQQGQCNKYLPQGQCHNNPLRFCSTDADCEAGGTCNAPIPGSPTQSLKNLTFISPSQISQIADLSGNVTTGLDWAQQGGANVIEGYLPWQLMRQIGGNAQIQNGDLEDHPPEVGPWEAVPLNAAGSTSLTVDFEDKNSGPNHILYVEPDTVQTLTTGTCKNDATKACTTATAATKCTTGAGDSCVLSTAPIVEPGAASGEFSANASEFYYAEARIKASSGNPRIRLQFKFNGYAKNTTPDGVHTYVDVTATTAWQRVTIGPFDTMSGITRAAVVCADTSNCSPFQVDDLQVRPILQVDTNPSYITPSCRLYPKTDAPSCDYTDPNGVQYKGWHGYCLEHDSQTGTCLSWWPVDIIKGESNIFGSEVPAGYSDRTPLYLCAEAAGNNRGNDFASTATPYVNGHNYNPGPGLDPNFNAGNEGCDAQNAGPTDKFTIAQCSTNSTDYHFDATGPERGLKEADIIRADWKLAPKTGAGRLGVVPTIGDPRQNQQQSFYNTLTFQNSSVTNPVKYDNAAGQPPDYSYCPDIDNGTPRVCNRVFREIVGDKIYWWNRADLCQSSDNLNADCTTTYLYFDKATDTFLGYGIAHNDQTGNSSSTVAYQVTLVARESCNKVVQVVTPSGQNQAYAQRANSKVYTIPELNFDKSADLAPFGGALNPPLYSTDPTKWPALGIETQSNQFDAPGQTRGGTPYACQGTCTFFACRIDAPSDLSNPDFAAVKTAADGIKCSTPGEVAACRALDGNLDGSPDGYCTGVFPPNGNGLASDRGVQSTGAHDPTKVNPAPNSPDNPFFAQERIRRVFAKSFGVFEWKADSFGNLGYQPLLATADWSGPTEICKSTTVPAGSLCATERLSCGATTTTTGQDGSNQTNAEDKAKAACSAIISSNRVGCNGVDASVSACSGGTQVKFNTVGTPSCSFTKTGNVGSWTCSVRCQAIGTYTRAFATAATAAPVTKAVRQPYPNDFCAVPPRIFCPDQSVCDNYVGTKGLAQFLTGTANVLTISGGSGSIGIKFNTDADAEQLPLSTIAIDWGDSSNPDQISFPFAPRNDPTKPHIFSHVYICNGGGTCSYEIRVQVKDNWGWCNDAKKNGSATDLDGTPDTACQSSPSSWNKTGLKVIIVP